jgi:phospholipase C
VNCADRRAPGVGAILEVLESHGVDSNCERGAYYLVNNFEPPNAMDGTPKALGATTYVYPPQTVPTIAETLSQHNVSWKWFTGGRDDADVTTDPLYLGFVYPQVFAAVKAQLPGYPDAVVAHFATPVAIGKTRPLLYNTIGDPLNASANIVGNPSLKANLQGLASFYSAVDTGTLPEVSFVVPKNLDSGHPGYSAPARYEAFLQMLIAKVQANPALWQDTAIVITTDEGGGYFDSGAIQPLDFFGDGPRIPLVVVSPYAKKNHVDHTYQDHASILKFIRRNWHLPQVSTRSRDKLPTAKGQGDNAYLPANAPAIGDLTTLFDFPSRDDR